MTTNKTPTNVFTTTSAKSLSQNESTQEALNKRHTKFLKGKVRPVVKVMLLGLFALLKPNSGLEEADVLGMVMGELERYETKN